MHRKRGGRPESGRAPTATRAGAPWVSEFAIFSVSWGLAAAPIVAWSDTYYVDNRNPSCSSSAPGTLSHPYCTISDAVNDHAGPGTTIIVRPGTYLESVDVTSSGTSAAPFVIQAEGPDVILDGADSFANPSLWTPYSGSVFLQVSVPWYPSQVFVDGARLLDVTGTPPGLIPPSSFAYVEGQGLYLNVGGDNPGTHNTLVGTRSVAFGLWQTSYVTIRGFHVTRFEERGIELVDGVEDCVMANRVDFCCGNGIRANRCSAVLIAGNTVLDNSDSGIALVYGTTGCTVQENECGRNVVPDSFHDGSGVYLFAASGNLIQRNRFYENNDEGLNIVSGSNNNVSIQNIAWGNLDHGFDQLHATGTVHIGDVSWRNAYDGFAVDGNATGTVLYDCIAVDNGLSTGRVDLWVDESSRSGFVSDYNIFWNSVPQAPIKYGINKYTSVAAYSGVSGQDVHTLQADPRFVSPAAGNFNLLEDSPAIDSGISGVPNWPPADALGHPRVDDPAKPNTGAGNPPYADRGALEFRPASLLAVGGAIPPGMAPLVPRFSPSPVRSHCDLVFFTTRAGPLEVVLYDLSGRRVRELMNDANAPAGLYRLSVRTGGGRGGALSSGIYFVRVRAAEGTGRGRFAVTR